MTEYYIIPSVCLFYENSYMEKISSFLNKNVKSVYFLNILQMMSTEIGWDIFVWVFVISIKESRSLSAPKRKKKKMKQPIVNGQRELKHSSVIGALKRNVTRGRCYFKLSHACAIREVPIRVYRLLSSEEFSVVVATGEVVFKIFILQ